MARQVLPIVGAVVGAYFGNPQLGYAIGPCEGKAVDPEAPQVIGTRFGCEHGAELIYATKE